MVKLTGGSINNLSILELNNITIFFSYETPVAFIHERNLTVRQNDWGVMTGRHLNSIDGGSKQDRISGEEFETRLDSILWGSSAQTGE